MFPLESSFLYEELKIMSVGYAWYAGNEADFHSFVLFFGVLNFVVVFLVLLAFLHKDRSLLLLGILCSCVSYSF